MGRAEGGPTGHRGGCRKVRAPRSGLAERVRSASLAAVSEPRCVELSNADVSELLCLAAEEHGRSDQQRRALRRAGRAALGWPAEASELVRETRSLTELRSVGPWLARAIGEWLAHPRPVPEPPPVRQGFLTRVQCNDILARTPGRRTPPEGGSDQALPGGSSQPQHPRARPPTGPHLQLSPRPTSELGQGIRVCPRA